MHMLSTILTVLLALCLTPLNASLLPVAADVAPSRPIPGRSPFSQCRILEPQALSIERVDFEPGTPRTGRNLTITASGILSEPITNGSYVKIEVKLGYIKLLTDTFDLCELLADNVKDLACPIVEGYYDLVKTIRIPPEVPPGRYTVSAKAYTVDNNLITCIKGNLIIAPSF
ncbi:hypothetical protein KAFR_0G01550 [Kazachstania africana CBS 2517]|uniref:Phosphatidylglycerol/phosphatidylinositol transfer protein n=1 Tax=Kazachstania africana (strain ATCC 22294 / BCRC 22015 / CBS 2517 / CECT 1963 / NBRC 1671 / NRRL Y-8276) TaxID=1071382 RepID=H2AXT9_KAZAF|nr:hypothetical protein KAFR_0G01550 [Kazachstania africana CBS 2517]CCF59189.1 hypothetical protein KAFR_0G01550 [Kazachstania africana CBS 2517]